MGAPCFELRVDRAALLKAVTIASSVVSRRSTIPILSYVRIEASGPNAVVTGTDLDNEMRVEIEAQGKGSTCLPAARLRDTLRAMSNAETVSLIGDKNGIVKLSADGVEASFHSLPADDHPSIKVGSEAWRLALPDGVTAFLIGGAAAAMSTEETRYCLNGVCFEVQDGFARATATDCHRLVSRSTKLDADASDIAQVIIHRDTVKAQLSLIGRGDATLVGHVGESKNTIRVVDILVPRARLRSKLIDGTFPDWRRVVPKDDGTVVEVVVSDLRRAMALARATITTRSRAVKLVGSGNVLTVSWDSPDTGSVTSLVPCADAVALPRIGMNADYLDEMARSMEALGSRTMRLEVAGAGDPIRILPDAAIAGTLAIVMPMRV